MVVVICLLKILWFIRKKDDKNRWRIFLGGFIFLFRWFFGLIRPVVLLCKLFSKFPSFGKFLRFYSFFGNLFLERRILFVSAWRIQMIQIQCFSCRVLFFSETGQVYCMITFEKCSLVLIEPVFFRPDQDKKLLFLKFDAEGISAPF